jgi:hypothetical protein
MTTYETTELTGEGIMLVIEYSNALIMVHKSYLL